MRRILRTISLVSCSALLSAAPGIASADVITGTAYLNIASATGPTIQGSSFATNGVSLSTLAAAEASSSGSVGFTSNTLNYDAGYGNSISSLAGFLTSDAGNTTITGALSPTQSAIGTLLVLTGNIMLTNGQTYTILHDDGANLYIGSLGSSPTDNIFSQAGQTMVNSSTQSFVFTGTTGLYSAELLYVSNYEAPSELVASSNLVFEAPPVSSVPEPRSIALLGTGLLVVAGMLRRRITA